MNNLEIEGRDIELRADGCLQNMADWSIELAEKMALNDGLELTQAHWDVLNIMRDYYHEYNTSPILKLLRRELSKKYDKERASLASLEILFPHGIQRQACRLAGVPIAQLDAELDQSQRMQSVKLDPMTRAVKADHYNDQFDFNGKSIKVYASGNLASLEDWNEELAKVLAEKEGLQLTDAHWKVITFLRKFYFEYGIAPMVKVLIKQMTEELGRETANRDHMYQLFPGGPAKQGSRIAGLPSPQGCIDG